MVSTAIVAGSAERVDPVVAALQGEGFDTISFGDQPISQAATTVPPSSVDCYVQMAPSPVGAAVTGADPLIHDLVGRLGDVTSVVPLLSRDATVLIVADGWDEPVLGALRVLAEAAVGNLSDHRLQVNVLSTVRSPADVVSALRPVSGSPLSVSMLADVAPELGFTDWRDEIMNATSDSTRSYFGWIAAEGPRAVVLSGAVLSPLPVPAGWATDVSWGEPNAGSVALAAGLLADALGLDLQGSRPDGDPTRAAAVSELAIELAEAFAKEVVQSLPSGSFELTVTEVVDWTRRHLCGADSDQWVGMEASAIS